MSFIKKYLTAGMIIQIVCITISMFVLATRLRLALVTITLEILTSFYMTATSFQMQ